MKIKILLLDDCISFGPKINQHEYIQATFEELSLEEPFFISLFTNTHLKESLEKFKKRMKLK